MQQILQSTAVTHGCAESQLFRHVDGNTTPVCATVQDITLMLLARPTSPAVLADAPAAPQAQRIKDRGPKIR